MAYWAKGNVFLLAELSGAGLSKLSHCQNRGSFFFTRTRTLAKPWQIHEYGESRTPPAWFSWVTAWRKAPPWWRLYLGTVKGPMHTINCSLNFIQKVSKTKTGLHLHFSLR